MTESATPESGALSVEQAIAALAPEPVEQAAEAPVEAAEEPEENTEGETSAPEEAEDGAETPAEDAEAEAEPEAVAPAEPPKYWSQDAKAKFAELPPELQAVVLQQEGPREEAAAKVKAEAAEKSQRAEAEMAKVAQLAELIAPRVEQWTKTFQSRWGDTEPDWQATLEHLISTQGEAVAPAELMRLQTAYQAERKQLAEAHQAAAAAQHEAREAQVKSEFAKLAEIAPELADPKEGPAKRTEVAQYLVTAGVSPEAVQNISATEMVLARKAMLWDQAQAQLKAAPKPKPAAPAVKSASVRPAAAVAQSPTQRTAQSVQNAFNSKPSIDNAVALLLARQGSR